MADEFRDVAPWPLVTRVLLPLLEDAWGATGDRRFAYLKEAISLLLRGEVDGSIHYIREIHKISEEARRG